MGVIEDQSEQVEVEEHVGYISGVDRTYVPKLLAALSMEAVPATFEQLPYLCEAGIKAIGTGATDGAGSDRVYTYTLPTTALNTIKTYTIEGGDNQQAEEMEYCFVEDLELSGNLEHWFERSPSRFVNAILSLGEIVPFSDLKKFDLVLFFGVERVNKFPTGMGIMVDERHFLFSRGDGDFSTVHMLRLEWKEKFWGALRLKRVVERGL